MALLDDNPLDLYERQADKLLADYRTACGIVDNLRDDARAASDRVDAATEALEVSQRVAAEIQARVHGQIAAIVSRCLSAVFAEPYEFRIDFERKRGKTEARLYFVRDGQEIDPLTAAGGGVVDVAAFALRLAAVLLHRPVLRPLLALDEPFKFVSADHIPRVRAMLDGLAEDLGVQFVIVTHIAGLQNDDTIRLG